MLFKDQSKQLKLLYRELSRSISDAKTLAAALQITQPAFARLWQQATPEFISFRFKNATQYALTRAVRDLGSVFPIYQITEQGEQILFGELTILANDQYLFTWKKNEKSFTEVFSGLPFFLQDLRPQGFLGALVPREHRDLGLDDKVNYWSDYDVLVYLARRGEEVFGNLIVGDESAQRFTKQRDANHGGVLHARDREIDYPKLAQQVNAGHIGHSSAGGDQPKFTTCIVRDGLGDENLRTQHVIVKFSPPVDSASGRRWTDLLVCEHLALQTLGRHRIPASKSELVMAADRVFLEVVRFDRIGASGRLPMVSILGLDGDLAAAAESWSYAANLLVEQKKLSAADDRFIRILDLFGALIGNSDRHQGNLSLAWQLRGRYRLLPCYDMLPMMYRPNSQGEIVDQVFTMTVLAKLDQRYLHEALALAQEFWRAVLDDVRVSENFKKIAAAHAQVLTHTGSSMV